MEERTAYIGSERPTLHRARELLLGIAFETETELENRRVSFNPRVPIMKVSHHTDSDSKRNRIES
jgi:hypothetical protein